MPKTQLRPAPPLPHAMQSPVLVAAAVLILYGFWLAYLLPRSHDGIDFVFMGRHGLQQSTASPIISAHDAPWEAQSYLYTMDYTGYDGRFYFFIALDPARAYHYLDKPSYRYTRIGYPMLARLLALGYAALVPYTLILVNWFAVAGGTLIVARWLKRKGASPWLALLYGLYPGLFTATSLDLAEPLAYGLVALAVYIWEYGRRYAMVSAGIAFGLAALTRETTLLFPLCYGLARLVGPAVRGERPSCLGSTRVQALVLMGLAGLPFIGYKIFLDRWLEATGLSDYSLLRMPLSGLFGKGSWQEWDTQALRSIVLPALLCAGIGIWALLRRVWAVQIWVLLLNVWVCVLCLQPESFDPFRAPARIATGVTLAALFCVPVFDALIPQAYRLAGRWWLIACAMLWVWLDLNWSQELLQIYTGCGQVGYGWAVALVLHCGVR